MFTFQYILRLFTILIGLCLYTPASIANSVDPDQILKLYGDQHIFKIYRNGIAIGQHTVRFEQSEKKGFMVTSDMSLEIEFLGFTLYEFDYQSVETWQAGQLDHLTVVVDDDGEKTTILAQRSGPALFITTDSDMTEKYTDPLFSTNHWAFSVVKSKVVLNTLTGNLNQVDVENKGREDIAISEGRISATRFDYTGELKDTSAWYDDDGRWVKLRFKARDGSTIDYRCQTCGGA